jgi:hypothetical protein
LRRRAHAITSHRLKRSETHFDGVKTAARTDAQDQGREDGDGEQHEYQYCKRYPCAQDRPPGDQNDMM